MKKSLSLLPFILLIIYYLTLGASDEISLMAKLIALAIIIGVSIFVIIRSNQGNSLSKQKIYTLLMFFAVTIISSLYFLQK